MNAFSIFVIVNAVLQVEAILRLVRLATLASARTARAPSLLFIPL